jgi:exoribonuclease R
MMPTLRAGKNELQAIAPDAMLQRGLLPDFSPAVIAQTDHITQAASPSGASVRDLRGLPWASIDNDDSRDLDKLSVAEPASDGAVKLLVAIADVDALVAKNSAIDAQAWTNTTSVYTAAQIFPMLPVKLSTNLTSLGEGQERLAIVIEMVIAADGSVTASEIYRVVVLNRTNLAYDRIAAWLEATAPAPPALAAVPGLDEQIRIQDRTAQALRPVRRVDLWPAADPAIRAAAGGRGFQERCPGKGRRTGYGGVACKQYSEPYETWGEGEWPVPKI